MSKLFNLYWPGFKTGYLICALFPFFAYLIAVIFEKYMDVNLNWLVEDPNVFLLCASPLMLTKQDHRSECEKLHVGASQKLLFLLLNFWVLVPVIIFASLYIGQLVCYWIFNYILSFDFFLFTTDKDVLFFTFDELLILYFVVICIVSIVLYYVVKAKKNRVLAGFISCFVSIFMVLVLGGVAAVVIYLLAYFKVAQIDLAVSYDDYGQWVLYGALPILGIIAIIYLCKLYKRLGKGGF